MPWPSFDSGAAGIDRKPGVESASDGRAVWIGFAGSIA